MEIFLRQLVLKLDQEDANWRDNTIILMDKQHSISKEGKKPKIIENTFFSILIYTLLRKLRKTPF